MANPIVVENQKPGTPQSVWDAPASNQIEGFATQISTDNGGGPIPLSAGVREITVELALTLLPHPQYVIDLALHRMSGMTIDWVERAAQFAALNVAEQGSDSYPWHVVRG